MTRLIKNNAVVEDSWKLVDDKSITDLTLLPEGNIIIPLQVWQHCKQELLARGMLVGVWLDSDESPEDLAADLDKIALVAINFPVFSDGRGYSSATLLRKQFNYKGEIRAIGDVLRDQLFYMKNCGIDSFVLRADRNADEALSSFKDFSESYQSTVTNPKPLFLRKQSNSFNHKGQPDTLTDLPFAVSE